MKYSTLLLAGLILIGGGCVNGAPSGTVGEITAHPADAINQVKNVNVKPGDLIKSPLVVTGEARGTWFFEANIVLSLFDTQNKKIDGWYAMAEKEWMTEDFVPFKGTFEFDVEATTSTTGFLRIERDNASGLPEHDRWYSIPVRLK